MDRHDPHQMLRDAVNGNRLIGIVMIVLGMAMCLPAARVLPAPDLAFNVLAVSASLFMIGPGVLYQVAAIAMKHREEHGGRVSLCVAICMAIPALLALAISFFFGNGHFVRDMAIAVHLEQNWRRIAVENAALMPPLATVFFAPASLVHAWNVVRAIRAIRLLPLEGHAFEVSMQPVQQVLPGVNLPRNPSDES